MEAVIADITIIGQLETIYNMIDNLYHYQQKVWKLDDICKEFADFVKEIETALRARASHLRKEDMFSADAKKQLDKLQENLSHADVLLRNLESPRRIAKFTGQAANKIQEYRAQIMESVNLLTFHMSLGPSDNQPSDLKDHPDRLLHLNLSRLSNPPNRPLSGSPSSQSSEHNVHPRAFGSSFSRDPESHTHYHSSITSHGSRTHSNHPYHTYAGSSNQPPPTRTQSMPSHSPSHNQHSPVTAYDPQTAQNLFRLHSPYHNPSPTYRRRTDRSEDTSQKPRIWSM